MKLSKMMIPVCLACLVLAGCGKPQTAEMVPATPKETESITIPTFNLVETLPEVTEPEDGYIPSNGTDFDRQWMLGCETMGWKFGDWMFKLGGLDATPQGMMLTHWGTDSVGQITLAMEAERYLEVWDGTAWQAFFQFTGESKTIFEEKLENGKEVLTKETWEEPLAPGYYRLGAYYTATMDSGDSYRQMCYAKFRIVDEETEKMVKQCQDGLRALLNQDSFHIFRTDFMLEQRDREDSHYYTQEIFKSGQDYYKDYRYYFNSDGSRKSAQAELYRGGKGQHWNSLEGTEGDWKSADFVTAEDFSIEVFGLECEPDILGSISRDGNTITILTPTPEESFHQEIQETELIYRFDDAGNLKEITLNYQFGTGEKETEIHLEVLDTDAAEIRAVIDKQ